MPAKFCVTARSGPLPRTAVIRLPRHWLSRISVTAPAEGTPRTLVENVGELSKRWLGKRCVAADQKHVEYEEIERYLPRPSPGTGGSGRPIETAMEKILDLLRESGISIPVKGEDAPQILDLRAVFEDASRQVEVDSDGSRRIHLPDQNDQLVWTADNELVVVHHKTERNGYYLDRKVVCAETTPKAAHWLTKMRLWRVVRAALRHAKAIGEPGRPENLKSWIRDNDEETKRLHHQIDAIGLVAEKTHQFSAQVFEPALLEPFRERCEVLSKAFLRYFVAELLRDRVHFQTRQRLLSKSRDAEARRISRLRIADLDARAAKHYDSARILFEQAQATSLANRCKAMTDAYAEAAAIHADPAKQGVRWVPQLRAAGGEGDSDDVLKLIAADDRTLANTVLSINRLDSLAQQQSLERHLAKHLVVAAQKLQNPQDMTLLLNKIRDLKSVISERTYINSARLQGLLETVRRQRPDLLPERD
jgi:hypothetical protein